MGYSWRRSRLVRRQPERFLHRPARARRIPRNAPLLPRPPSSRAASLSKIRHGVSFAVMDRPPERDASLRRLIGRSCEHFGPDIPGPDASCWGSKAKGCVGDFRVTQLRAGDGGGRVDVTRSRPGPRAENPVREAPWLAPVVHLDDRSRSSSIRRWKGQRWPIAV